MHNHKNGCNDGIPCRKKGHWLGSEWADNQGSNNIMHNALIATVTIIMGEF